VVCVRRARRRRRRRRQTVGSVDVPVIRGARTIAESVFATAVIVASVA
jgi:hypothetical protein